MELKRWIRFKTRPLRFFWQKYTRGYSDMDLWNLNGFLANLLLNSIKDFRKYGATGYPCSFESSEQWDATLKEMEEGFLAAKRILEDAWMNEKVDATDWKQWNEKETKKFNRGMYLFHKYFFNLWD
jgi:hypothetical protein